MVNPFQKENTQHENDWPYQDMVEMFLKKKVRAKQLISTNNAA